MPTSSRSASNDVDPTLAIAFVVIALIMVMLFGIDKYRHRETANRVHVASLTLNVPMTRALTTSIMSLPKNVEMLHCWVNDPDNDDTSRSMSRVVCDATLQGRSVQDLGSPNDRWTTLIDTGDSDDSTARVLSTTALNFSIERPSDGSGLQVKSNVDTAKVTFDQTLSLIRTVLARFQVDEQQRLDDAQAQAPDTVRSTWVGGSH